MSKLRRSLVLVPFALGALVAAPASAITNDWVEDNEHPFVGLLVMYDESGEFVGRCSGSLLDPTTFLTAGHCVDGAASARVYFQQDAGANYDPATGTDPVSGYPETCAAGTLGTTCAESHTLYNYGFSDFVGFPDTHDVGLVILDQRIVLPEYGVLADAGALDGLATARGTKGTVFTVSGYGVTYRTQVNSAVPTVSYRERLMATSSLVNLRSANTDGFNLQTQGNGKDRGGTCSGDSGGPVFLGDTDSNTIVGVTSFGLNALCRGVDFAYRTDQQDVLDWIANPS